MFRSKIYSFRYGLLLEKDFSNKLKAIMFSGKSVKGYFHHDYYELFEDDVFVERILWGYDLHHIIVDLKSYCSCPRDIAAWEMFDESFRWFVYYNLIEPTDNFLDIECGYYSITDNYRKLGEMARNKEITADNVENMLFLLL